MSLSIGIVGLPNVGKSTLFNALTKKSVPAENYPFCTIDPSVGVVAVPDDRLGQLGVFSKSVKTVPAAVEFVDIAGLVAGAADGEGLGNKFLSHIREVDAIAHVVRVFEDSNIIHVHGKPVPKHDAEVINLELGLADLDSVKKRIGNLEKEVRAGKKEAIMVRDALVRIEAALLSGKGARTVELTEKEIPLIKGMHLLTMKPMLYVLNRKSGAVNVDAEASDRWRSLTQFLESQHAEWVFVDAGVEQELSDFEGEEKSQFRREFGVADDGLDALIKAGYHLLDLISFFTTGEKETRAWTIRRGAKAPEAGAAIHSDFRDKFIRAETCAWDKLLEVGSWSAARDKGLIRAEGKEYVVQDGDVMEFRHG